MIEERITLHRARLAR